MSRWFSPALLPYLRHPAVDALPDAASAVLLRRGLVRHLVKVRLLARSIVAPLARQLASGQTPCRFGQRAKRGDRLARDAEWHARQVDVLLLSLGLDEPPHPPACAVRLDALLRVHARDDDDVLLITLLFAVVTETAGPQLQVTLATDPDLHPDVRTFFLGQGQEGRWHADYFGARMRELWGQLSRGQRDRLGPLIPALIWAAHGPDRGAALTDLAHVGLSQAEALTVLAETWPLARSHDDVRCLGAPTMTALERAGVMHHPLSLVSLVEAGLLGL